MNELEIKKIIEDYTPSEIAKAFLTALIFFVLYTAIFLIPVITIIFLFVPYMLYFLIGIYMYMVAISYHVVSLFIRTLQTYRDPININDQTFQKRATISLSILILITEITIYYLIH